MLPRRRLCHTFHVQLRHLGLCLLSAALGRRCILFAALLLSQLGGIFRLFVRLLSPAIRCCIILVSRCGLLLTPYLSLSARLFSTTFFILRSLDSLIVFTGFLVAAFSLFASLLIGKLLLLLLLLKVFVRFTAANIGFILLCFVLFSSTRCFDKFVVT